MPALWSWRSWTVSWCPIPSQDFRKFFNILSSDTSNTIKILLLILFIKIYLRVLLERISSGCEIDLRIFKNIFCYFWVVSWWTLKLFLHCFLTCIAQYIIKPVVFVHFDNFKGYLILGLLETRRERFTKMGNPRKELALNKPALILTVFYLLTEDFLSTIQKILSKYFFCYHSLNFFWNSYKMINTSLKKKKPFLHVSLVCSFSLLSSGHSMDVPQFI